MNSLHRKCVKEGKAAWQSGVVDMLITLIRHCESNSEWQNANAANLETIDGAGVIIDTKFFCKAKQCLSQFMDASYDIIRPACGKCAPLVISAAE